MYMQNICTCDINMIKLLPDVSVNLLDYSNKVSIICGIQFIITECGIPLECTSDNFHRQIGFRLQER